MTQILPSTETVEPNYQDIAKEMKARGVINIEDGWTNTLMDILEEKYEIETKVKKEFDLL